MCPCNGTLSHRFEIYILRISNVRIVRMRCTLQRFLSRYFNSLRIRKSSRWGKRVFEKQTKIRVVVHGRKKLKEFFFFFFPLTRFGGRRRRFIRVDRFLVTVRLSPLRNVKRAVGWKTMMISETLDWILATEIVWNSREMKRFSSPVIIFSM